MARMPDNHFYNITLVGKCNCGHTHEFPTNAFEMAVYSIPEGRSWDFPPGYKELVDRMREHASAAEA